MQIKRTKKVSSEKSQYGKICENLMGTPFSVIKISKKVSESQKKIKNRDPILKRFCFSR